MQNIEEIYKEYFEIVNKYLFCLTHNNDISEELTQETFYKAVRKIKTFRGQCKLSVWLCQIAKNLWYNELKKCRRILITDEEYMLLLQNEKNTEDIVIENDEKSTLYQKMGKLDEKTKKVMYLRIIGEFSFKEIATILNKTENWARVTFYRGKEKLKGEIYYDGTK